MKGAGGMIVVFLLAFAVFWAAVASSAYKRYKRKIAPPKQADAPQPPPGWSQVTSSPPAAPVLPPVDPNQQSLFGSESGAEATDMPLIHPDELPLKPDDPRLAILRERYGDEALRKAGLL